MKMNRIARAIVEKKFFLKAGRKIEALASRVFVNLIMRSFCSIDQNLIFFTNFSGEYECNPGYICKELDKRDNEYKLVFVIWGGRKHTEFPEQFPESIITVKRYSYDFYKALCSAKIIIDNGTSFIAANYKKKKKQILISTWHGSLGIKKFSKDDTEKNIKYNKKARAGARQVNYMISNSAFENFYYKDTFWPNTPILMLGHARNDILFKESSSDVIKEIKERVRNLYEIPQDASLCLYAPTFRDSGKLNLYDIDYEKLKQSLVEKFGGDWVILTKFHFRTKRLVKNTKYPSFVYNVSNYPDIQELLAVIDAGITDYSSWICEYIHTRKPGFLYATDLEDYNIERGFYDPIDAMPFPLATNDEELSRNILNFDQAKYEMDCEKFLSQKGCIDDGKAASRICDQIDLLMKDKPVSCKIY